MFDYQRIHDVGYELSLTSECHIDLKTIVLANNNVFSRRYTTKNRAMTEVTKCHGPKIGKKVHQKVPKAHH